MLRQGSLTRYWFFVRGFDGFVRTKPLLNYITGCPMYCGLCGLFGRQATLRAHEAMQAYAIYMACHLCCTANTRVFQKCQLLCLLVDF
jgi:hypothetical protein